MANLPISGLTASAANAAATDVLPVVQTTGVGPVKMTIQQVIAGILGSSTIRGATVTTSQPLLDLAQTWNNAATTFTALKLDVTNTNSAATSLLIDVSVGGSRRFQVTRDGALVIGQGAGAGTIGSGGGGTISLATVFSFNPSGNLSVAGATGQIAFGNSLSVIDTFFGRKGAANWRIGTTDAGAVSATVTITIASPGVITWTNHLLSTGTPVVFTTTGALPTGITAGTTYYVIEVGASTFQIATSFANALAGTAVNTSGSQSGTHTGTRNAITQRLSAQGVTGVTDRPGADLLITGSQGTGTGAGGSIIFQVAPAGSSGTAQNALATALTIDSARLATFADGIRTAAPTGGTAATWKLGVAATVSPTSPNRTIEVDIGGTIYYIAAKTTND